MENTLEFKGPFNIKKLTNLSKELSNQKGIYIWGFIGDKDDIISSEKGVFDNNKIYEENKINIEENEIFVPYYTGQTSNLFQRILNHSKVKKKDALKYTRFNKYPLISINSNTHFASNKVLIEKLIEVNNIYYFNNDKILNKIYKDFIKIEGVMEKKNNPNKLNYPIDKQSVNNVLLSENDPLNKLINNNNFFFYYLKLDNNIKFKITELEAFVFFHLKFYTISKVNYSFEELSKKEIVNNLKLVNKNNFFKNHISTDFPGY
jgi:hypothetical protein